MKKYVINLNRRPDKLETVTKELNRVGILNWERFNAIETPEPRDGCRASHLSVLNLAPKRGVFAVFEDDVKFIQPLSVLKRAMSQLPKNWDMLWLGSTLTQDLDRYSENLYRLKKGWTTHAYLVNNQNGVVDYILNNSGDAFKIDVFYADVIQEQYNCFVTYPMVASQRPGYSDIVKKHTEYKQIKERYELYTKKR
jgi:GR25 family glycosyltransferase involved in LPS biosynthesis